MNERRLIAVSVGGGLLAIVLIVAIGVAVRGRARRETQQQIDLVSRTVSAAVQTSEEQCRQRKYDEAIRTAQEAQKELGKHPLAYRLEELDKRLSVCCESARAEREQYRRRLTQGWSLFEGQFISPEDKSRLLQQRERAREQQARAEAEVMRRVAEERKQAEAERRRREQLALEEKARQMYGPYKEAAEKVADNLLKLISATQTGITIAKHSEMLQELQFTFNKFSLARSQMEQTYSSFAHLSAAVEAFKAAQGAWKEKIELIGKGRKQSAELQEEMLQAAWAKAMDEYKAAMRDLGSGK